MTKSMRYIAFIFALTSHCIFALEFDGLKYSEIRDSISRSPDEITELKIINCPDFIWEKGLFITELKELKTLILNKSSSDSIPDWFYKLKLKCLDLSYCEIPIIEINRLSEISNLNLNGIDILNLYPNEVQLVNLQYISLYNCKLGNEKIFTLFHLAPNLKGANLSGNNLDDSLYLFKNKMELEFVENLRLNGNMFKTLIDSLFIYFPNLQILNLEIHDIETINIGHGSRINLKELNVLNPRSEEVMNVSIGPSMNNLQLLRISRLGNLFVDSLPNLKYIQLYGSYECVKIHESTKENIQTLYIGDFTKKIDLSRFENLKSLNIEMVRSKKEAKCLIQTFRTLSPNSKTLKSIKISGSKRVNTNKIYRLIEKKNLNSEILELKLR